MTATTFFSYKISNSILLCVCLILLCNTRESGSKIAVCQQLMPEIKMDQASVKVEQAGVDADLLIVDTAISLCGTLNALVVVGEDVALLVLLTALSPPQSKIYLRKPGRSKTVELYCVDS